MLVNVDDFYIPSLSSLATLRYSGIIKTRSMEQKEITIEDVLTGFKVPLSSEGRRLVQRAYEFANTAHDGQKRASGVPYIQHCLATAQILAEMGMDARTVAAGLMHDVPEDTPETLTTIRKEFGEDIAQMIDGITKLGKIKLRHSQEDYMLENWRRMFLAMASDIRTVIIKLADRLHNLRTLEHLREDKRRRIAHETMEIYIPLANRLGIGEIRGQMSDLCFKYLDPKNYDYTKQIAEKRYKEAEQYIERAITTITEGLKEEGIKVIEIHGRAKFLYSLFLKLQKHDMEISRIYDLAAIRIIVPEIVDCYEALGIIHKRYRPMVGRIKDYISLPKPNGYQSLHTTIFGPEGRVLEVQIRTQKMHDEAEFGIAAHWLYEENKRTWKDYFSRKKAEPQESAEVAWVKQLQEWQNDVGSDSQEFMEGLKIDFLKNHIFAFTPKGDVIELPEGGTPIDFAYAIHSEIGDKTNGAKVNAKMVALDYTIRNGDVIEILTDKNRVSPNQDWLTFTKTRSARSHIRQALKKINKGQSPSP